MESGEPANTIGEEELNAFLSYLSGLGILLNLE